MNEPIIWIHSKLKICKANKINGKERRRSDHLDIDETILYVLKSFLDSQTPMQ